MTSGVRCDKPTNHSVRWLIQCDLLLLLPILLMMECIPSSLPIRLSALAVKSELKRTDHPPLFTTVSQPKQLSRQFEVHCMLVNGAAYTRTNHSATWWWIYVRKSTPLTPLLYPHTLKSSPRTRLLLLLKHSPTGDAVRLRQWSHIPSPSSSHSLTHSLPHPTVPRIWEYINQSSCQPAS